MAESIGLLTEAVNLLTVRWLKLLTLYFKLTKSVILLTDRLLKLLACLLADD